MKRSRYTAALSVAGTLALWGASGCNEGQTLHPPPTWEEFQEASTKVFEGQTIYVVEWDRPIASLDKLREYYDTAVNPTSEAGADPELEVGQQEQGLMVNRVSNTDDVWSWEEGLELTYCVSTAFGSRYSRARSEMAQAAEAWMRFANVRFIYDSSQDSNCTNANNNVTFAVRPWTSGGACAFFPSGDGCVARTVVIDYFDLDNSSFYQTNAPNMTTVGVLRHELGHVLGARHEHTNGLSGTCFEDNNWRSLTSYDSSSVMHYQWCNGVTNADMSLTPRDIEGSIELYGMAVPLMITTMF